MKDRVQIAKEMTAGMKDTLTFIQDMQDPVEQRRAIVRAARKLRDVADLLDDFGRLTE